MIIDMHAHFLETPADKRRLKSECRQNGVAVVIVSCLGMAKYERNPSDRAVRAANACAQALADASGGRVRWLAYLNPQSALWRRELANCLRQGACGIKLWVALKDRRGRLDRAVAVLQAAARLKQPVLIHTFNRTDPLLPGEINMETFAALAERVPGATLIAAHAGGNWRQSLAILRTLRPGTAVDICGGFPGRGMVEALVGALGAERVLFGSDATGRSMASQLAKVMLADLPRRVQERILWKNAAALFGLKDWPPAEKPCPVAPLPLPDFRTEHFCFCGHWPFFETPCPTPVALNRALAAAGIRRAYAADLDGLYRMDVEEVNRRFLETSRRLPHIKPLAVLNPRACNWRQVLELAEHGFAGIIVFPCLQAWRLDDPAYAGLFRRCADRHLGIWINAELGDPRFRHSGSAYRPILQEELMRFSRRAPANAYVFQALPSRFIEGLLAAARRRTDFRFDISRLTDMAGALARCLRRFGAAPFVLGSEFPFRDVRSVRWVARRELTGA